MRRLCIAAALLLLVFGGCLESTRHLGSLTGQMTVLLTRAETLGAGGSWEEALSLTQQAEQLWGRHTFFFHVILRHSDTDAITHSFSEVKAFLAHRSGDDYAAANAVLLGQIRLLHEQECCDLKNLL